MEGSRWGRPPVRGGDMVQVTCTAMHCSTRCGHPCIVTKKAEQPSIFACPMGNWNYIQLILNNFAGCSCRNWINPTSIFEPYISDLQTFLACLCIITQPQMTVETHCSRNTWFGLRPSEETWRTTHGCDFGEENRPSTSNRYTISWPWDQWTSLVPQWSGTWNSHRFSWLGLYPK